MPLKYGLLDDGTLMHTIAQQREAEALSVLYDRYSRLVFSVALQLLGDRERSEETTLDVFTRVWEKADTYQPKQANFRTWVVSIARNRAIDRLRRSGSRPESDSVPLAEVDYQLTADADNPEQAVEKELQAERVYAALATLPEEQRQVIVLAYFRGYTQREMADELGLPLGTVKTRVRLGMEKLRESLVAERTDPESGPMRNLK